MIQYTVRVPFTSPNQNALSLQGMYPSVVGGGGTWNTTDGKPSELTGGTPPQMDLVGAGITVLWVQCILG